MTALLSVEEARRQMLVGLEPLPAEEVELLDARGRALAEPVISRLTLPPWDNSAMDGFAVRAEDIESATRERPVTLDVVGEVAAGRVPEVEVAPRTAVRILTGALLPAGADAVVPVEGTDAQPGVSALPGRVAIFDAQARGAHIRRAGSDVRSGDRLLEPGSELTPAGVAVAAAGGHSRVTVHRRPRVAVLATGDELAAAGSELGPAQIPDSNSVGLAACAVEAGAEVRQLGIARDEVEDVIDRLRVGLEWADAVIASGGVSVGAHDVVKDAFVQVGRVELWRIAVQPGKPLAFGRAPAAGRLTEVLLFGLPGNPVSSLVTFELFVRPVLRRLAGHTDVLAREVVCARLGQPVTKSAGRRAFLRVKLVADGPGWRASLAGSQDSHVLSALAAADGLAIIPESYESLPAGSEVEVIRIR